MERLARLWRNVIGYKVDPDTVIAYRSAIPSTIDLQINQKGDTFIATIKTVDDEKLPKEVLLVTEALSSETLVDMVNDLIFTYKNIPETYRPYYRQILKPQGAVSRTESLKLVKAS